MTYRHLMARALLGASLVTFPAASAVAETAISWESRFWDRSGNADLVLPLPCGGAMAFQRVDTPVPGGDPASDRPVQMGLASSEAGYVDYLRRAFIRGGFSDPEDASAFYYIGRYELTRDQHAALLGNCPRPSLVGTIPASGLSWFDAVDAARRMTEWLRQNAPRALPHEDGAPGFVRLPTEVEWEYAVRGGAAVDGSVFNQRTYPLDGPMRDHGWHQGAESARGQLRPVGLLGPNPVGLHDVYGNVEEIMFEPFRLNALGRLHGQPGGVVTRGGSILSRASELSSGLRQEFPAYSMTDGKPVALDTFGVRFVIGIHLALSTERTNRLRNAWLDRFNAGGDTDTDASLTDILDILIAEELELERRLILETARLRATEAAREREAGRLEAMKALIIGGAVLVQFLREDSSGIELTVRAIATFDTAIEEAEASDGFVSEETIERLVAKREEVKAGLRDRESRFALNFLSYRRNLVTSATGYDLEERDQALGILLKELELSGREGLKPLVRDFHEDIAAYAANPSLETPQIRALALE